MCADIDDKWQAIITRGWQVSTCHNSHAHAVVWLTWQTLSWGSYLVTPLDLVDDVALSVVCFAGMA